MPRPSLLTRGGILVRPPGKGTAGDQKGPPNPDPPTSPLRTDDNPFAKPTRVRSLADALLTRSPNLGAHPNVLFTEQHETPSRSLHPTLYLQQKGREVDTRGSRLLDGSFHLESKPCGTKSLS